MSELKHSSFNKRGFRWHLLASVSAVALSTYTVGIGTAYSSDETDRPTVWVELGGQLKSMTGGDEPFAPSFIDTYPKNFFSPLDIQKPLGHSFDGTGSISFEPRSSDWVFSAAVQFGRANATRHQHQQTANALVPVHFTIPIAHKYFGGYSFYPADHVKFEDAKAQQSQTHTIVDFNVGKDIGFGIFGNTASSVLSGGVRFAQFTSKSNVSLRAEPDVHYGTAPLTTFTAAHAFKYSNPIRIHDYAALMSSQRSFRGIGPSVSWTGSNPVIGNPDRAEITLDWGANASILFGRQKVQEHHQTTTRRYYGTHKVPNANIFPVTNPAIKRITFISVTGDMGQTYYNANVDDHSRSRSVVVPNVGGMAGLSVRYSSAKVSFGYRADFFFGAMDGGIDVAKRENQGFYGPFASISIGLGG